MSMHAHPIHFRVEQPARMERIHVLIRLLLLVAVGTIGFPSVYLGLYIGLPAYAALLMSQKSADRYLAEDAPVLVRAIRWASGATAYLWLLTDTFPVRDESNAGELEIDICGKPTPRSALLRILYSFPALLLLFLLSIVAGLFWLIGAIAVLVRQRVPVAVADFLAMILCYQVRLLGYHLSLVDRYPSFEEAFVANDFPGSEISGAGSAKRA